MIKQTSQANKIKRKKIEAYYEKNILTSLAQGTIPSRVAPAREYRTHGMSYGKEHYELQQKQHQELLNALVHDVQAKQKADGLPVQTAEMIADNFNKLAPMQQRLTKQAIYIKSEHLAQESKHVDSVSKSKMKNTLRAHSHSDAQKSKTDREISLRRLWAKRSRVA